MRKLVIALTLVALAGCTTAQLQEAGVIGQKVVADGQLFCAKATADGPLVVALANAAGAPVIVTGLASAVVAADCAAINSIPVETPANAAEIPTVAAVLPTK